MTQRSRKKRRCVYWILVAVMWISGVHSEHGSSECLPSEIYGLALAGQLLSICHILPRPKITSVYVTLCMCRRNWITHISRKGSARGLKGNIIYNGEQISGSPRKYGLRTGQVILYNRAISCMTVELQSDVSETVCLHHQC
jgi:hypothetical protein